MPPSPRPLYAISLENAARNQSLNKLEMPESVKYDLFHKMIELDTLNKSNISYFNNLNRVDLLDSHPKKIYELILENLNELSTIHITISELRNNALRVSIIHTIFEASKQNNTKLAFLTLCFKQLSDLEVAIPLNLEADSKEKETLA